LITRFAFNKSARTKGLHDGKLRLGGFSPLLLARILGIVGLAGIVTGAFDIGYVQSALILPRVLGVLLGISGLCYLTNGFLSFLAPSLDARLFLCLSARGTAE